MNIFRAMRSLLISAILFVVPELYADPSVGDAAQVYADYKASVFQLSLIERGSDTQSSLGSGFLVADDLLATNFHVVSSAVAQPEKYSIEFTFREEVVAAYVVALDVVSDLAILRFDSGTPAGEDWPRAFPLRDDLPSNGDTLYSLGNPHNLGMTVVEGNFNGIVEHRYVEQIHFSGAVNPGMSGGPVVDQSARVVGINVATAGNQIGFLVPVKALSVLLARVSIEPQEGIVSSEVDAAALMSAAGKQVLAHTEAMVAAALATPWEFSEMGEATVQSSPLSWLECWGGSENGKQDHTYTVSRGCHSGSSVYLARGFNSGFIEYEFFYFEAPDWPKESVYRFLAQETANARPANSGSKDQLSQFECQHSQVRNASGLIARTSYCSRYYYDFPGMFDAFFMAVTSDRDHQALMSHYTLSGVSEQTAQQFLAHFIEVVSWTPQ